MVHRRASVHEYDKNGIDQVKEEENDKFEVARAREYERREGIVALGRGRTHTDIVVA